MCTNVGRAILKAHLAYHKDIPIAKIYCLSQNKGINKSNYDNYYDLKIKYNLPIQYVDSINEENILHELKAIKPSILIQSGWSQKFSNRLLEIPNHGCIGEHPAPLPKGKGAACINWAIINGERNWGDSFFIMNDKYDDGKVISQEIIKINPQDNVSNVYEKIAYTSFSIIKRNLKKWLNGDFNFIENKEFSETYFKPRKPEDGEINENIDAITQYNFIRALTKPYPGAFFIFNDLKIIIWEADYLPKNAIKDQLNKYTEHIYFSQKQIYLKGSCGNFLIPKTVESEKFPIIENNIFFKYFFKNI